MGRLITPTIRTQQPQDTLEIDRNNVFGQRCTFAWTASKDRSGQPKIFANAGHAVNFNTFTAAGKSLASLSRPFTIVLVMAFPVASVGSGYGIYVGSGNGFRLDLQTTGGGIYAGWTANGVANGSSQPRDGTATFDMRPVVLVSDWTATGQTSWWKRQGEPLVTWTDSLGYINPTDSTVYLGQNATGCQRHYAAFILKGNVGETGAKNLIENPWQIFKPLPRSFNFSSGTSTLTYTIVPSGSVAFVGANLPTHTKVIVPDGTTTIAGTASLTFINGGTETVITPEGSVALSGNSVFSRTKYIYPTGSVTFTSTNKLLTTHVLYSGGTALFAGSATLSKIKILQTSGTLTITGTVDLYQPGAIQETTKGPLTGVGE